MEQLGLRVLLLQLLLRNDSGNRLEPGFWRLVRFLVDDVGDFDRTTMLTIEVTLVERLLLVSRLLD